MEMCGRGGVSKERVLLFGRGSEDGAIDESCPRDTLCTKVLERFEEGEEDGAPSGGGRLWRCADGEHGAPLGGGGDAARGPFRRMLRSCALACAGDALSIQERAHSMLLWGGTVHEFCAWLDRGNLRFSAERRLCRETTLIIN